MFRKYRQGLLPDSQWKTIAGAFQHSVRRPGVRQVWKELRPLFSPEFREFLDGMVENAAGEQRAAEKGAAATPE